MTRKFNGKEAAFRFAGGKSVRFNVSVERTVDGWLVVWFAR